MDSSLELIDIHLGIFYRMYILRIALKSKNTGFGPGNEIGWTEFTIKNKLSDMNYEWM
jgi:hypothetical protein